MVKFSKAGISLPFYVSACDIPVNKEYDSKKRAPETTCTTSLPIAGLPASRVSSVPALSSLPHEQCIPLKKRIKRSQSSALLFREELLEEVKVSSVTSTSPQIKPDEYFRNILRELGQSPEAVNVDHESFVPIEQQQHPSYPRAAMAARNEDLDQLRKLHCEGQNLQCANQFGESIIHIVCRRSRDDILDFLVSEVGVSLRLRDDLGRTPLHDAAWTDKPNFKVAGQLLSKEPDLIHTRDKRGNSPLAYIPQQNWGLWNAFLEQNKDMFARLPTDAAKTVG